MVNPIMRYDGVRPLDIRPILGYPKGVRLDRGSVEYRLFRVLNRNLLKFIFCICQQSHR
jgi:hypothetical protein